jgi:5-formyltetrahydrofolate cyclo-ligase
MTDNLSKDSIRHEALLHRDRIDPRSEDPDEAAANFMQSIRPEKDKIIGLYWPKAREFDCLPLLHDLLRGGWECALPVIEKGSRILKFAAWREDDPLEQGPFGIMQPAVNEKTRWLDPDIVVIPYLAFDRHGHRIGYGGGYYDATLRHCRSIKQILAVGYGYAQQTVLFNLPADMHDEKLDWVVTAHMARKFVETE